MEGPGVSGYSAFGHWISDLVATPQAGPNGCSYAAELSRGALLSSAAGRRYRHPVPQEASCPPFNVCAPLEILQRVGGMASLEILPDSDSR
jgi:hypothetical protein